MIGNLWEWVQDDYHDTYDDAPVDGTAWIESPSTGLKVYRGGRFFTQTYMTTTAVSSFLRAPIETSSVFD